MTKEEYDEKSKKLREEYEAKQKLIDRIFAVSNAPEINTGDIIFTKYGEIGRVEKGIVSIFSRQYPELYYKCEKLTKKLEPNKRDPKCYIYPHEIDRVKRADTGETVKITLPEYN